MRRQFGPDLNETNPFLHKYGDAVQKAPQTWIARRCMLLWETWGFPAMYDPVVQFEARAGGDLCQFRCCGIRR